ncbi:MAG: lytic murein transglycosylase [Elusimicrobiota bacterium]
MKAFLILFLPLSAHAEAPDFLPDAAFIMALEQDIAKVEVPEFVAVATAGPVDKAFQLVMENLNGTLPQSYVERAFKDPEVKIEPRVVELINKPAEQLTYEQYRKIFITESRISAGVDFLKAQQGLLSTVNGSYKVEPGVLLGIVGVETFYGRNKGSFKVFNALYTIIHEVPKREKWAVKELAQYLLYCDKNRIAPLSLMGSYAGAFGYGQFIPSSHNHYSVDFDGDGSANPYQWPDVFASVSNYLVKNGYKQGSSDYSQGSPNWNAIFAYNHSENYVKVVLELRQEVLARYGQLVSSAR